MIKRIYIYTIFFSSILFFSSWSNKKENTEPCMKLIQDSYKAMYPDTNIQNRAVFIDFTMITNYSSRNNKNINKTENAKVYSNGYKSYYISDIMDVYQDKNTSVAILKDKKTIIINYHIIGQNKKEILPQIPLIHEKIFENVTVTSCNDIKDKNNNVIKKSITLSLNEKLKTKLNINSIEYLYDIKSKNINEVMIDYPKSNNVKNLKIIYHKINMNDKSNVTKKSPLRMVFDKHNNLLSQYKNYQIKDYRKK